MPNALLIDGDATLDPELEQKLSEMGFDHLCHAHDKDDAIAQARQHPPDLVVVGDGLPGDEGISAARRICSLREVPVLMATRDRRRVGTSLAHGAVIVGHFSFAKLPEAVQVARDAVSWNEWT